MKRGARHNEDEGDSENQIAAAHVSWSVESSEPARQRQPACPGSNRILMRSSVVTQFEMCPSRPEEHGTERPLQNRHVLLVAGFVEAARFLGGQTVAPSMAKLTHYPPDRCVDRGPTPC